MSRYHPIEAARIDWLEDTPKSRNYDDIYFSTDDGIAESSYVFLQGNNLPQRWQNRTRFTIAETGFGTGLNFLCTLEEWFKTAPADAQLNYISIEKHPLTKADMQQVLNAWPTLSKFSAALLEHYPMLVHGMHQRRLFNGRVTLSLLFGDAADMFADLDFQADAWYLDGFAPSKNPDMWSEALFNQIARLSNPGGSFATFTAAGVVRRGLKTAGFEVNTISGFGRKRDMSVGRLTKAPKLKSKQPWFKYPSVETKTKQAIVIGAGLAGCTVSHSLAQQGWQITLIERHAQVAQEASGNLAGVVMPRLTADMSVDGQFYLSAFLHTTHWFNQLKKRDPTLPWFQSGVLQLCDEKQQQRMAKLGLPNDVLEFCDKHSAKQRCGLKTKRGGLFYPGAGWLNPPALCQWLLEDQIENINTLFNQDALTLKHENGIWHVVTKSGVLATAETVIIANAYDAERLLDTDIFTLQKVRGQLAYLLSTQQSEALKTPVCYDGYIIPAHNGLHCVGASYDIGDNSVQLNVESEREILTKLTNELPEFDTNTSTTGRVAFRTTTQDHLPLIGPVPDIEFYQNEYVDLHHGKPAHLYPRAKYLPNLFINVGHGSRGLVSAPLAAANIISYLDRTSSYQEQDSLITTHPARFLIRKLKRASC